LGLSKEAYSCNTLESYASESLNPGIDSQINWKKLKFIHEESAQYGRVLCKASIIGPCYYDKSNSIPGNLEIGSTFYIKVLSLYNIVTSEYSIFVKSIESPSVDVDKSSIALWIITPIIFILILSLWILYLCDRRKMTIRPYDVLKTEL
jgi:hypothetical protein